MLFGIGRCACCKEWGRRHHMHEYRRMWWSSGGGRYYRDEYLCQTCYTNIVLVDGMDQLVGEC